MNKLKKIEGNKNEKQYKMFEDIKHIDENGVEFWYARELQILLEYAKWDKFTNVINKAIIALKGGKVDWIPRVEKPKNINIENWIIEIEKPIITGKGKKEIIKEYKLSRFMCYLIVENGDSRKPVIALGQQYFAIQTRKQELSEKEYHLLTEDEKRFYIRNQTKQGNYTLQQVAKKAGVKDFAKFHNSGYKGLYNGETADDIAKRKGLRYREDILDNMGSEELANNLFRIVQTESKLKNDNVQSENKANKTHFEMGRDIRKFISKKGGTMPEDLPTPKKSLKQLEKENKNTLISS
jgi:DNA-damage-inducible protein D